MDSLCLKTGIHGIAPPISVGGGIDVRPNPNQVSAMGRSTLEKSTTGQKKKTPFSRFSFKYPLKSLWPGKVRGGYDGLALDDAVLVENGEVKAGDEGDNGTVGSEGQSENWVLKILHARSLWREEQGKKIAGHMKSNQEEKDVVGVGVANDKRNESNGHDPNCEESEACDFCRVEDDDEENEAEFDRDSFTQMLRRVSLADARLYAQMSYLGNLAYDVSKIKSGNLLRRYGLHYVISSIDKRELAAKAEKKQETPEVQVAERDPEDDNEGKNYENHSNKMSASAAYHIAASAASYLYSHTRSILPFKSLNTEDVKDLANQNGGMINSEMANLMATTDSVTAVVAAKEEVKQAVADDLNSKHSSPCEWFICDDDRSGTRIFAIQGSESLSSWQANLLFEPIKFEGLDLHVHRGIYEAAKGIYEQVLPEVHEHLKSRGGLATFRFSGHSLGGSLALLINLMLLIRNEVPVSSLLPVITFGAPSVMCGGDNLLCKLGLPRKHVQAIMMHRDIVPRAFSCNYPNHVAEFLKAINGNFRNHPCLNNQKLLYAPMGELLILQPDEKLSPNLDLLPSGAGLYLLSCGANNAKKQLRAAKTLFFNSPHPLEVLGDRSSYGSDGSIQRDHDMNSYLKSVRGVIRQELNDIRKANKEHRDKVWWPLLTTRSVNAGILVGRSVVSINMGEKQSNFSGIMQTGRESLKRFSRFVASQHMRLFVVLLFPARLLVLGTFSVFSFR